MSARLSSLDLRQASRARARGRNAALGFALLASAIAPADAQQAAEQGARQQAAARPGSGDEPWRIVALAQSSLVFGRDGSLIGETGREWRTSVPLRSLPKYVGAAFIAVEDQRFYQHDGVDVIGVASAVKGKILGARRGGASTITQQLVGNMHPELIDRRDLSFGRKLREQQAAREMEKRYNKEQILEAYLNTINFGHGWYGVESAARHYFGKSSARLTLGEAALLAALPKSPVYYDPGVYPDRARQRRDLILGLMAQQGLITLTAANAAKREPIQVAPNAGLSAPAHYFVDAVRQEAARLGFNVFGGGFRVFTTLDPALQRAATSALADGVARLESQPGYQHQVFGRTAAPAAMTPPPTTPATPAPSPTDYLQGAAVVIDPTTGDVRALVGGRSYAASPFNRATAALRQPGSAFKPFVYAKALETGIASSAIVPDTAIAVPLDDGTLYEPRNVDTTYLGMITIREALVKSRNTVSVQLGLLIGMDSVAALAGRVGIETPVAPFPSSALGASAVNPLNFVAAYTAFANLGQVVEPRLIARIEDASGRVVYTAPPPAPRQVLDPRVAFMVRDVLREAAERGTGAGARRQVPAVVPIAGKTGTTNDNVDVWFVGMTPDLVGGVWLGFDKPKMIMAGAGGGSLAAPIWGQMIARYYIGRTPGEWTAPTGLTFAQFDRETGQLATPETPMSRRYVEYFIPGTEPEPFRTNPWKVVQWGAMVLW
ncbi:MAG: penicillin-binding protein 1A [Gemmatimonadaceae bacterium]